MVERRYVFVSNDARNAVIEECAVAVEHYGNEFNKILCRDLAAILRNLKSDTAK